MKRTSMIVIGLLGLLFLSAGSKLPSLHLDCQSIAMDNEGILTCDGTHYQMRTMTGTWSEGRDVLQIQGIYYPEEVIARDDSYFIQKCHRWQNVHLDVLENDEIDLNPAETIVIVTDVYFINEEGAKVSRLSGYGSFPDLPFLVARLSQNEVMAGYIPIEPDTDFYYLDYQIQTTSGALSNIATVAMEIIEPMPSSWCQTIYSQTGVYHTVENVTP